MDILLKGLDPLGYFPELKNIRTVDGNDYATLYQQVLVDLPIGGYFRKFLDTVAVMQDSEEGKQDKKDVGFISKLMQDFKAERIKNLLKKVWISDFHRFCM